VQKRFSSVPHEIKAIAHTLGVLWSDSVLTATLEETVRKIDVDFFTDILQLLHGAQYRCISVSIFSIKIAVYVKKPPLR
jgi:hypothetical protein